MTAIVLTTPEADKHIRVVDTWWRRNRPRASDLFLEELAAAFDLLSNALLIGRHYAHRRLRNVRRILLRSSRYHLYYRIHKDAVIVLAVWSAVRGAGPGLRGL